MSEYNSRQLRMLEPGYSQRLGLKDAPFSSKADDHYTYIDAEHEQVLNMLRHMTQYSGLVLLAEGVKGIGKSTLMQRLILTAPEDWYICRITAAEDITPDHLLFNIAQGFEATLSPSDPDLMQEALLDRLGIMHQRDQTPILLIDDADKFSMRTLEALLLLADVESDNRKLLNVIMFADPAIESRLETSNLQALRERLTHTLGIPPFNDYETGQYIQHRLKAAGYTGELPISDKELKKIIKLSEGIPALINEQAHKVLEQGGIETDDIEELDPEKTSSHGFPWRLLAGGIVIILVALLLRFQDEINTFMEGKAPDVDPLAGYLPDPNSIKQQGKELAQQTFVQESPTAPVNPGHNTNPESITAQMEKVLESAEQVLNPGSTTASDTSSELPLINITGVSPSPVPGKSNVQTITIKGSGFTRATEVMLSWPGGSKQLNKSQTLFISAGQIDISVATGTRDSEWNVTAVDPEAGTSNTYAFDIVGQNQVEEALVKTPTATINAMSAIQDEQWILARQPEHFSMQLLGSRRRELTLQYVRRHNLTSNVAIYRTEHEGGDWYVLLYGDYKTRAAAINASKVLPSAIRNNKPWIRRFDDIQSSLNSRPASSAETIKPVLMPRPEGSRDEAWIWSQDPRHFTVQLLSGRDNKRILQLIERHKLQARAVIFHTSHDGRDWYTLVFGNFADKASARKGINSLPEELRQQGPWIRSFANIHSELHRVSKP